jgi:hypothetical protein
MFESGAADRADHRAADDNIAGVNSVKSNVFAPVRHLLLFARVPLKVAKSRALPERCYAAFG